MRFFARLTKLFDEGLAPWLALLWVEFVVLAWIFQTQ